MLAYSPNLPDCILWCDFFEAFFFLVECFLLLRGKRDVWWFGGYWWLIWLGCEGRCRLDGSPWSDELVIYTKIVESKKEYGIQWTKNTPGVCFADITNNCFSWTCYSLFTSHWPKQLLVSAAKRTPVELRIMPSVSQHRRVRPSKTSTSKI